jgi:hypothetical protein
MSRFRFRDEEESSSTNTVLGILAGAVAGFAIGVFVAQRVGGIDGLTSRLRRRRGAEAAHDESLRGHYAAAEGDEFGDIEEDELEAEAYDAGLEDRVLEAFRNDPILAERAIDIGSISDGVIELAGWVEDEDESRHAVTIARGVPGVDTVVNRIALGDEERRFDETARRFRSGDPSLTEARWEGSGVGTGRRRQGNSAEPDRHATPKAELEDRWQDTDAALRNAAEETDSSAERRTRAKRATRGDRTGGAPVAPSGVPKADHVVRPLGADSGLGQTERTDPML